MQKLSREFARHRCSTNGMGGGHPVHVGRSKQGNNGPLQSYSGFGSGVVVGQDASLTKLYQCRHHLRVRLTAGDQIFVVRLVLLSASHGLE